VFKRGRILWLSNTRPVVTVTASVAALLLVGAGSYALLTGVRSNRAAAAQVSAEAQSSRRDKIGALGRIEPYSEIIDVAAGTAPDRLDSLFVQRGDLVKKGQVLGYLGGYAEESARRQLIGAQLDEAKQQLKTEVELDQARIKAAELHQKQVLEVMPQTIAAQQATVASLQAKLDNDQEILDSQQQLLSRGSGTKRQTDDQNSLVLQDKANVQSARAHLSELTQQFEIDKVDAGIQIETARATLDHNQSEVPLASLERQIALSEARAKRMTIYAPIDGRILNIMVKAGEEVGSGPILAMGDTSRMRAVAEVYETDISRVSVGQRAEISSRALSKPITGRVARIGDMIFKNDVLNVDPAARADARVVQVWIDLDDAAAVERLTNLTVDVLIDTAKSDTSVVGSVVSESR
jgi:HlyD family secretion protein